jgi:hypothetical protein
MLSQGSKEHENIIELMRNEILALSLMSVNFNLFVAFEQPQSQRKKKRHVRRFLILYITGFAICSHDKPKF